MTPSASNESSQDERVNQVIADYLKSVEEGQPLDRQELLARHPDLAAELAAFFADRDRFEQAAAPLRAEAADGEPTLDGTTSAPSGPGTTVRYFGDYELLDEIARGGMGVVYKARQVNLKRIVALKLILAGQLAGPHDVARFHAEAEAAAKLDHPGIVPIFEIGEHEGQHYFSMAFVDGESLAHRIAQGVMEPREAAALMKQVAEAIAYAHVEGVIHRDLKPGNILLQKDEGGRMKDELSPGSSSFIPHPSSFLPRVTDFGLAKRVEGESQGLTATGQVLGTPSYMPPEQAAGDQAKIGPLADVYSLGAVLYCLLTGRPPFQAASAVETLLQVMVREPVRPRQLNPAVPRDLETIALKCLEKDPARRYPSAQELANELQRFLDGRPIVARPLGAIGRGWRWCRRNKALAATIAAAACLVLAISGVYVVNLNAKNVQLRTSLASEETARKHAESARETADQERRAAETARQQEAAARKTAEVATQQEAAARRTAETATQQEATARREAETRRVEAEQAREESLDRLCNAQYEQARMLRLSNQPGRRGQTLELLAKAEVLRKRPRAGRPKDTRPAIALPSPADLRSEALLALLLPEARVVRSVPSGWISPSLTPDRRLAAVCGAGMGVEILKPLAERTGPPPVLRLVDLSTGEEHGHWECSADDWPLFALSPDGRRVASGRPIVKDKRVIDFQVRIWEIAQELHLLKTLSWPRDEKSSWGMGQNDLLKLAFAPNGKHLAGATGYDELVLWNLETGEGKLLWRETAKSATWFHVLAFSADGKRLALARDTRLVRIWDVETGQQQPPVEFPLPVLGQPVFGDRDRILAAVCREADPPRLGSSAATVGDQLDLNRPTLRSELVLWDLENRVELARLEITSSPMRAEHVSAPLALSPDGRYLAAGGIDVFDCQRRAQILRLSPAQGVVRQLYWQADGRHLVSVGFGFNDSAIKVWELRLEPLQSRIGAATSFTVPPAFSPNGRWLAASGVGGSGQIEVVDRTSGQVAARLGETGAPVFSPDSGLLALVGKKTTIVTVGQWDRKVTKTLTSEPWSAAFNRDGELLVLQSSPTPAPKSAGAAKTNSGGKPAAEAQPTITLAVVNVNTMESILDVPTGSPFLQKPLHFGGLLSADGTLLAAPMGNPVGLVLDTEVWDVKNRRKLASVKMPPRGGTTLPVVQFSPDNRLVVVNLMTGGVVDGMRVSAGLMLWDLATKKPAVVVPGQPMFYCYAFTPDSKLLAVVDDKGAIRLHDVQTGGEVLHWDAEAIPSGRLAFTPDGRSLAFFARTGPTPTAQLLDVAGLRQQLAAIGMDW